MTEAHPGAGSDKCLRGGSFYGSIAGRQERCDAIFTDLRHSSARKLPAHSHELPFFAVLLEGDYRESYGRQQTQFCPFSVSFRPAGVPHQDEVGPRGVRFFEIEILPSWRQRLQDCSGTLDVACDDHSGGAMLCLALNLFRETREPAGDDLDIENLLTELVAAVGAMPNETTKGAPSWLLRITDKLNTEYCQRITLLELSKEAGVHPVHLSRVFRRCQGEGIGEYLHRLRIRAACQQMLTPETALADIGLATGFADQSHFTRAFRKTTGMTPAAFRAALLAPPGGSAAWHSRFPLSPVHY